MSDLKSLTHNELRDLAAAGGAQPSKVRDWALRRGLVHPEARGPVPRDAYLAYLTAHGVKAPADPDALLVPSGPSRCGCSHLRIHHRGGAGCSLCACLVMTGPTIGTRMSGVR